MTWPDNFLISKIFLVIASVGLLCALEAGARVITATLCLLLASNFYATEALRD